MSNVSEALRKQAKSRRAQLYQSEEGEFALVLAASKELLPNEAENDLFPFVIRSLWRPFAGEYHDVAEGWFKSLPERYTAWCADHAWLLKKPTAITGQPPKAGIEALARLLISIRQQKLELLTHANGEGAAQ